MAMPAIRFRYVGQVHSPFSGQPTELNGEAPNEADPTLLFVYYGDADAWDHVSPRLPNEVTRLVDNIGPDELAESLDVDGAVMFIVDADWSGISYYAFAPEDSEIKFRDGVTFTDPVE